MNSMTLKRCFDNRSAAQALNAVIHSRNLYSGHSRFINAQVLEGVLTVENLQTGQLHPFENGKFRDGYGAPVNLDEKGLL